MIRRSLIGSLLAAVVTLAAGTAQADAAAMATATKYGCLGCHGVASKVVGPGFREVADKYKADKSAEAALTAKVRAGGAGNWGPIPMPPQAGPTDSELKAVVGWILAGAQDQ
jgi:cytochrome c551/c552